MKMKALAICLLGSLIGSLGLLIAADEVNIEAVKKERRLSQGTWRVAALEGDGIKMPEEDFANITVLNELDGNWIVKLEGEIIWKGTSTIDPTKNPKTIDFRPTDGADVGKTFFGIYEIAGDVRRLCYAEAGKERPAEFVTYKGSGRVLVTFKRERPIAFLPK
jgi:uncharacterized protein (TIGR03067 family)